MICSRTLAALMLVAVGARVAAAAAMQRTADATVVSLSVVPKPGRADVVVGVQGSVTIKHFTLRRPDQIVVELSDATLGLDAAAYDGVARGGITRIRCSQFTDTVIRVVLTLDAAHPYGVSNENGEIHISVEGAGDFSPWNSGGTLDRSTAPSFHRSTVSPEQRVTYSPENAPIADVLAAFSSFTGRTILPSKNVQGAVTANILNQPWDVALKKLMNANGYDVIVDESGIIIVDTFDAIVARQASVPLQTWTVRLNYSRALAVRDMVAARLTHTCVSSLPGASGLTQTPASQVATATTGVQNLSCPQRGTVTADTISNAVSITDVPTALPELLEYARSLDLRPPQVNIKAKIILVDRSQLEGMGLRYDLGTQNQYFNDIVPRPDPLGTPLTTPGQITLGGNVLSSIANASARVPGAALELVHSIALGNYDFTSFLEALRTNALLDVQAEPSASVLNNRTANLTAGTQVPIRVIDANSAANNISSAPRAQVSMQQTGIILTVTPQVTANRQVQMRVHVENSDVQFQDNDVGAVFPTQKVDNEVLVADGETAVMGGLTQTSVSISKSGIPILVNLPVVGRFFGVTNRRETKRDLLILITPRIIDAGQAPEGR
jgi:type IV pilus assembly protein PilQ